MAGAFVSFRHLRSPGVMASLSLRKRLLLLLALASLPGILVAVFLANSWLKDQNRQIATSVERLARLAAARNETVTGNAKALLVAIAQRYSDSDVDFASCKDYLSNWLQQFPAFTSLTLYNRQGDAICTTANSEMPARAGAAAWFDAARSKKNFVLGQYMLGRSGQPILAAVYPIMGANNFFRGAVALAIDLRWLDFLGRTIALPDNATVSAVNARGQLLSHNAAFPLEKGQKPGPPPSQRTIQQITSLSSGLLRGKDTAGNPRIYGVQKTRTGNLVIAVGQSPYLGFARYRAALLNTLAAPVLIILFALVAAAYASEAFVTRYVLSLARTAQQIERGNLTARSEIPHDKYEIGRLAAAFDHMAAEIESDQENLKKLAAERETLIREINHRVKNNLQIVLSMLRPSAGTKLSPEEANARIKSMEGRIQTLAQIHQLLYDRYDNATPSIGDFVAELTRLLDEFSGVKVAIAEIDPQANEMVLSIGQAINLGLIINELVANAEKHAFAERGEEARVDVTLKAQSDDTGVDRLLLTVADNGIGLPDGYDLGRVRSMGSRIVRALALQLGGELWFERLPQGTAFHLRCPVERKTEVNRIAERAIHYRGGGGDAASSATAD